MTRLLLSFLILLAFCAPAMAQDAPSLASLKQQTVEGEPHAAIALARYYQDNPSPHASPQEIDRLFQLGRIEAEFHAANGDAAAMSLLGELYWHGWGVTKDREQAINWWKPAAEQEHAEALLALGKATLLEEFPGYPAFKAVRLLERAGHQGKQAAWKLLARYYLGYYGHIPHPQRAREALQRLIAAGDEVAQTHLNWLEANHPPYRMETP